jgi:CHAT domain/SIR2-like domain
MEDQHCTLNVSLYRIGEAYQIEISHTDPASQAEVAPLRAGAAFDLPALLALGAVPDDYGKALAKQLFADKDVKQRYVQVEAAVQATGRPLRFTLTIDPSAQELQSLRWELLRHPDTGAAISTSETLLFSRFMVSRDFRPIKLRARAELSALVAVSAPLPGKLQKMELSPVDFAGEVARATAALAGVKVRVLGGPDAPFTLDRLLTALRGGVDVLYLVSHGMFGRATGAPALILEDDKGEAAVVKGEDLAVRVGELQKGPRLVVLASCQSAGDGKQVDTAQRTSVQATLAGRLADAGVPAIIAMQGFISMPTVEKMMPVFFTELLRDGQIDRALAAARGKVRDRTDAWMPALYTRLTTGRLWYTPGFTGARSKDVWRGLLPPVRRGKVVPILGARLLEAVHGDSHDTARRLAEANHFPLSPHEWDDLPRVTAYVSVKETSRFNAIEGYKSQLLADLIRQHRDWLPPAEIPPANKAPKLGKLLSLVGDRLRESQDDVFRMLAELPASVYVTTNFDPLLERALKANQKDPQQIATRWRYQKAPPSADEQSIPEPTAKAPLVYHAFGAFGGTQDDRGLVLTEDDYFDYLIKTSSERLTPPKVEAALVDNSLLFLGFRLTDWHFRVLFRLMMSLGGKELLRNYCHVAVQLDPDLATMADVNGARAYLSEYFGKEANIQIFWGSVEEFLKALRDELAAGGEMAVAAEPEKDDDEFDF